MPQPPSHDSRPRLILASGSRYKRELLSRLDLDFEAIDADIDESARAGERPEELARRLAWEKASALALDHPEAYILGADQVVSLEDRQLHKPGGHEAACAQLAQLQGREHDLRCAVALRSPEGARHEALVRYVMQMRSLSSADISRYVDRDEPYDCAGSYRLEAGGIQLFRAMRGDDHTAIIGLALTRVWALLERAGYFE